MQRNLNEYNKAYYRQHSEVRRNQIRNRQKLITEQIREYKLQLGCFSCGYNKSSKALHFHHLSDDKEYNIARMCSQGRRIAAIMHEISKCICLCANCHAEQHDPTLNKSGLRDQFL